MQDKKYSYRLEFMSQSLDEERLRNFLEENFKIKNILICRDSHSLQNESIPIFKSKNERIRYGKVEKKILRCLDDERVWRAAALIVAVGTKQISQALHRLLDLGNIQKLCSGHYCKAGLDPLPKITLEILALRRPSLSNLLHLLETPKTAVELRESLNLTRQAVDQKLKRLMNDGLIQRIKAFGERGQHVYLRADQQSIQVLLKRPPALKPVNIQILSSLKLDIPSVANEIFSTLKIQKLSGKRVLSDLSKAGLVEITIIGNTKVVKLTNKGFEHPQYNMKALKAPVFDPIKNLNKKKLDILLILNALGEAKSRNITLLSGIDRGMSSPLAGTGQMINILEHLCLIEKTPSSSPKGHPSYQLTRQGHAAIATLRGTMTFPDTNELRTRLIQEKDLFRKRQRERIQSHIARNSSNRALAIIGLLQNKGPLKTGDINTLLPNPYPNPRSVYLMLNTLEKEGKVKRIQTPNLRKTFWAIP